jgi:peptide/nickel transport system ATP-binding protein/oligopeptide transport system ATP-binding protein
MKRAEPLIRARGLSKSFPVWSGTFRRRKIGEVVAVKDIDLDIQPGEVLGCVGETGSGKSTLGRLILNLIRPDSGEVRFDGTRIDNLAPARLRAYRRDMQVVFQDPLHALNPRRTVAENISLPLVNFGESRKVITRRVAELLDMVGLNPAHANRYPHEFSGGQCQRIGIARAIALNPRFVFLDEPVSALDVSVQAQILNLLMELRRRLNLTYLFVTHDLKIVRQLADRIIVLYHGHIVESSATRELYDSPYHPYSRALLDSILRVESDDRWRRMAARAEGEDLAEPSGPSSAGCIYVASCPERFEPCRMAPRLTAKGQGRAVACHLYDRSPAAAATVAADRLAVEEAGRIQSVGGVRP